MEAVSSAAPTQAKEGSKGFEASQWGVDVNAVLRLLGDQGSGLSGGGGDAEAAAAVEVREVGLVEKEKK